MAFDATAQGNWGCLPEHYPAIVDLVLVGQDRARAVHREPADVIDQRDLRGHARAARLAARDPHPGVMSMSFEFKNHDLMETIDFRRRALREQCRCCDPQGKEVDGLHVVRITLDNPKQYNSYTTDMVKGVILAFRQASNDRALRRRGLHRGRATRRSAPAATPRNTPSTTRDGPRSTSSTCACSTTWSPRS